MLKNKATHLSYLLILYDQGYQETKVLWKF